MKHLIWIRMWKFIKEHKMIFIFLFIHRVQINFGGLYILFCFAAAVSFLFHCGTDF